MKIFEFKKLVVFILMMNVLVSCSIKPYSATNKMYKKKTNELAKKIQQKPFKDSLNTSLNWVGTTNFNLRKPNFVIIHHTAQNSCEQTLKTFTTEKSQVSAHYVICKDGIVHHMLNDYLRAQHAGIAKWGNNIDINSSSIGIEIDNNGFEKFTDEQINSLLYLLEKLKKNYTIPTANFIGHSDIAPARKVDPNVMFPWKQLSEKGFGNWYNDTTNLIVPPTFDPKVALRVIGYDVSNLQNAIAAFKRHFMQIDKSKDLSEIDKKVLYATMMNFL